MDNSPTGITVNDEQFYRGSEDLHAYIEDGAIFTSNQFLPFIKTVRLSRKTDFRVDKEGNISGPESLDFIEYMQFEMP